MDLTHIAPEEALLKIKEGALLIHTLPAEHFGKIHLPGATNVCVYQNTFLDDMKASGADKSRVIILYGSSRYSLDAVKAAEKLHRDGYRQIFVLEGGIVDWQEAGFPVEGDTAVSDISPGTQLPSLDGYYQLDTGISRVGWSGRNQNSKHFGTLLLKNGHLIVRGRSLTGELVVDMDTMENINLTGDELQPVLIAHLKSDDFFFTRLFPTTTFVIDQGEIADIPYMTCANSTLKGSLNLRGITKDLDFPATITPREDGILGLEAHFDLDRTHWNIIYGSSRFFEHLGMHAVFDQISIELRLILKRSDIKADSATRNRPKGQN
ncbi:MAG: YceI family protein [Desulfosporosinus sp.]|nr:YceI family protein [Desulfosporosinus sp.]